METPPPPQIVIYWQLVFSSSILCVLQFSLRTVKNSCTKIKNIFYYIVISKSHYALKNPGQTGDKSMYSKLMDAQ